MRQSPMRCVRRARADDAETQQEGLHLLEQPVALRAEANAQEAAARTFDAAVTFKQSAQESCADLLRRTQNNFRHVARARLTMQPQALQKFDDLQADDLHLQIW